MRCSLVAAVSAGVAHGVTAGMEAERGEGVPRCVEFKVDGFLEVFWFFLADAGFVGGEHGDWQRCVCAPSGDGAHV